MYFTPPESVNRLRQFGPNLRTPGCHRQNQTCTIIQLTLVKASLLHPGPIRYKLAATTGVDCGPKKGSNGLWVGDFLAVFNRLAEESCPGFTFLALKTEGEIPMSPFTAIAELITVSLDLRNAPVAICLTDVPPADVPASIQPAAAGCVFWERGTQRAFFTSARDHENCAVGMYTHNMPMAPEQQKNLNDCLSVFHDLGYLRPADIPEISVLKQETKYVLYAPLSSLSVTPTVVLLFANSRQSLAITEAVQQVDPGVPPALGRPACAVIPQVVNTGKPALSLGCCGARAYLDGLTDDFALWALPGVRIEEYASRIAALANANSILTRFHQIRRRDIEAGERPSVKESITRLQTAK